MPRFCFRVRVPHKPKSGRCEAIYARVNNHRTDRLVRPALILHAVLASALVPI